MSGLRNGMGRMIAGMIGVVALAGCNLFMTMHGGSAERPAASEFGLGPRTSASGAYVATIETSQPLHVRRMQSVKLTIRSADDAPVDGATITVDGGMPEHGHGLPTEPRVTRNLGAGVYQVEGLKFNMGGWWELKFRISSAAGTDTVTFNLAL